MSATPTTVEEFTQLQISTLGAASDWPGIHAELLELKSWPGSGAVEAEALLESMLRLSTTMLKAAESSSAGELLKGATVQYGGVLTGVWVEYAPEWAPEMLGSIAREIDVGPSALQLVGGLQSDFYTDHDVRKALRKTCTRFGLSGGFFARAATYVALYY
jgi:hypothetical protein